MGGIIKWLESVFIGTAIEKPASRLRWIILVLACLMLVGSYYSFDIPGAIKQQIDDYFGDPSDYESLFSLTYTLYAAPNVILPFFGGYFVDKFGVRICLLVFASLILAGQIIFSFGVSIKSWPVVLIGRLVFGFGGESLTVANSALLAEWFRGRELAFSFGVNLSIAKLGSVINDILSPKLAKQSGVPFACWFGVFLCAGSLLCVVVTMPIDKYMDVKGRVGDQVSKISHHLLATEDPDTGDDVIKFGEGGADAEDVPSPPPASIRDITKFSHIFWVLVMSCVVVYGCVLPFNNISSSLLLERDYFVSPLPGCALINQSQCESPQNGLNDKCSSSQWAQHPLPYNATIEGVYFPGQLTFDDIDCTASFWADGCASFLCNQLQDAEEQAGVEMSIPYIISAVLSPFLGIAIDNYGMRAVIAAIAPAILIAVHLSLGLTTVDPMYPLIGQGLAYTGFAAVLWPAVPLVIEERLTGLGFGIVTSMQNLGCAIFPLIVAAIYTSSNDHYIPNVEFMFAALGVVGLVVGLYMNYYDWHHDSILNRSEMARAAAERMNDEKNSPPESTAGPIENIVLSPFAGFEGEGGSGGGAGMRAGVDEEEDRSEGWKTADDGVLDGAFRRARMSRGSADSSASASRASRASRDGVREGGRGGSFTSYGEIIQGGAFSH